MGESGHGFVIILQNDVGNLQFEKQLKRLKTVLDGNNQQTQKVSRDHLCSKCGRVFARKYNMLRHEKKCASNTTVVNFHRRTNDKTDLNGLAKIQQIFPELQEITSHLKQRCWELKQLKWCGDDASKQ